MSNDTQKLARSMVASLLGEDYSDQEEFARRPGGPDDPLRQVTIPVKFKKKDFSGKRPAWPPGEEEGEKEEGEGIGPEMRPATKSRFDLNFGEAMSNAIKKGKRKAGQLIAKRPGKVTSESSATLEAKKPKGKMVAKKPGKVSYREALIAQVAEAMKKKKGAKGQMVAKKPGKIRYCKENDDAFGKFWNGLRQEIISNPSDREFIESVESYVGGLRQNASTSLVEWASSMNPAEWASLAEQATSLREAWEADR